MSNAGGVGDSIDTSATTITSEVSQGKTEPLLGLYRAELEHSKLAWRNAEVLRIVLLAVSCFALFVPTSVSSPKNECSATYTWFITNGTYVLAVLAAIMQLVILHFQIEASNLRGIGEQGRRLEFLQDALGIQKGELVETILRRKFSQFAESQAAKFQDRKYFQSTLGVGSGRLLENTQESAFYSAALYDLCCSTNLKWGGGLLFVLVSALFSLPIFSGDQQLLVARFVLTGLSFFVSCEYLNRAWCFHNAKVSLESLITDIDRLLGSTQGIQDSAILSVFTNYHIVTAGIVVQPSQKLYEKERPRLKRLWEQRAKSSSEGA